MLYRAKNKTTQGQRIHFIDGSSIHVNVGQEVEIDEFKIYKFELERINKFFEIVQAAFKDVPCRVTKKVAEPEIDFIKEDE